MKYNIKEIEKALSSDDARKLISFFKRRNISMEQKNAFIYSRVLKKDTRMLMNHYDLDSGLEIANRLIKEHSAVIDSNFSARVVKSMKKFIISINRIKDYYEEKA